MKTKEIRTIWKIGKLFWTAGLIFWAVETGIFLLIEGWHLKATNPIEIFCDKVASNLIIVALNLSVFSILRLICKKW